jgi:pimeloyl-ACP methyl ester carboxylesterase
MKQSDNKPNPRYHVDRQFRGIFLSPLKLPFHLCFRPGPLTALLACLVFLSSCATTEKPDLERLYQQSQEVPQVPVVLIHGVMGAHLSDSVTGEEAWFGNLLKLAFSSYEELALKFDPQTLNPEATSLYPTGLAEQAAGRDFYGSIIRTLEQAGHFVQAEAGQQQTAGARNYYVFAYDWRQDNVVTAGKLLRLIDQIRLDHGKPDLKVDLIAHSMGGLIARYFLRYGDFDTLDDNDFPVNLGGASRVRRVVLLGTPNLGSVSSLHAFITGYKIGFGNVPTEVLATWPSVYQLFPHALNDWLVTVDGKPLQRDLFDVNIWRRFEWSIFDPEVRARVSSQFEDPAEATDYLQQLERYFEKHLERARRFTWSLTVPLPQQPYKLIVFGGDCKLTPARIVVEEVNSISEIRLWPDEITQPATTVDYDRLMLEPGDGTVTKASLLARESLDPSVPRHRWVSFPLDYPFFLCESHETLTNNVNFQDNLLHTLLSLDLQQ